MKRQRPPGRVGAVAGIDPSPGKANVNRNANQSISPNRGSGPSRQNGARQALEHIEFPGELRVSISEFLTAAEQYAIARAARIAMERAA